MRGLARAALLFLWVIVSPLYLTERVIYFPEFIPFPASCVQGLFELYVRLDPKEDGYDFGLTLCWLLLILAHLLVWIAASWLWRRRRARQQGKASPPLSRRAKVVLWTALFVMMPMYLTDLMLEYPQYIPFPESTARWLFDQYQRLDPTEDGYAFDFVLCWLLSLLITILATAFVRWRFRRRRSGVSAPVDDPSLGRTKEAS